MHRICAASLPRIYPPRWTFFKYSAFPSFTAVNGISFIFHRWPNSNFLLLVCNQDCLKIALWTHFSNLNIHIYLHTHSRKFYGRKYFCQFNKFLPTRLLCISLLLLLFIYFIFFAIVISIENKIFYYFCILMIFFLFMHTSFLINSWFTLIKKFSTPKKKSDIEFCS